MKKSSVSSKQLYKTAQQTFNVKNPSTAQLKYVMTMLVPSAYLLAHHTVHGHPITFIIPNRDQEKAQSHRPWQIDIINDQSQNKAVMKSRQLGLSEMHAAETLWFIDRYSENAVKALYAFPTLKQMNTFVKTRFNPVLSKGYYATIVDDRNSSIQEKVIRNSFLIFRSSSKASSVEGVDIDYLALDEYDRVGNGAEDSAVESMASSKFKMLRRFSTPTVPDYGIDKVFKKSDMKYYMHECTHCGYLNRMKYADYNPNDIEQSGNIRMVNPDGFNEENHEIEDGTFDFVCQKCGKHLDRWYNGRWVALHPERKEISGYFISQLNAVWISADQLKRKEYASRSLQTFHNYVLGEPYLDQSMAIFPRDIWGNLDNSRLSPSIDRYGYDKIAVGIDWGEHDNHIVVIGLTEDGKMDVIRLITIPVVNSYKNPDADINKTVVEISMYNPDIILADLGFNGTKVNRLIQEFGKEKVFGVKVNPAKAVGEIKPKFNKPSNTVTLDKLSGNLFAISQLKSHHITFWNDEKDPDLKKFLEHAKNVMILEEEDDDGILHKVIRPKGSNQPDHYFQAFVYTIEAIRYLLDEDTQQEKLGYMDLDMNDNLFR